MRGLGSCRTMERETTRKTESGRDRWLRHGCESWSKLSALRQVRIGTRPAWNTPLIVREGRLFLRSETSDGDYRQLPQRVQIPSRRKMNEVLIDGAPAADVPAIAPIRTRMPVNWRVRASGVESLRVDELPLHFIESAPAFGAGVGHVSDECLLPGGLRGRLVAAAEAHVAEVVPDFAADCTVGHR